MLGIIILIISIYLDGFLTLYLPYLPGGLSIFTPMLTIVSIFIIYPLYRKREKQYFITLFIVGIIYDLLYTNLLLYDALVFMFLGLIIRKIYKNFTVEHLKLSIHIILLIVIYELLISFFIIVFNLVPISLTKVIYKITHSILLNIIYGELLYTIIKKLPNKYKKISIN